MGGTAVHLSLSLLNFLMCDDDHHAKVAFYFDHAYSEDLSFIQDDDYDIHRANPYPGQQSDKFLVLLTDSISLVEHHQPAWTGLQISDDLVGQ